MNQNTIKETLQKIYKTKEDYIVVFTSKKNKRVNGCYRPSEKTIIINNGNFTDDEGKIHENKLLYTAIHELTHHIIETERGGSGRIAHSKKFWSLFYDLVDIAEKKGLYKVCIDDETQKLIDEARELTIAIAELQRKLGEVLIKLEDICAKKDIRREDVVERQIQITNISARTAVAAHQLGNKGLGMDIQTQAARASGENKGTIINAGLEGKTVVQASDTKPKTNPAYEGNALSVLYKEKSRIEKTIESLEARLIDVNQQLTDLEGKQHVTKEN